MPDQYRKRFDNDRGDDRRSVQDRAGEEIRSWFGDDELQARRGNDESQDRYPYGGERGRSWQDQGDRGREPRPWRGDERGTGQARSGQYGPGGQYGSSSYDRGSYGANPSA